MLVKSDIFSEYFLAFIFDNVAHIDDISQTRFNVLLILYQFPQQIHHEDEILFVRRQLSVLLDCICHKCSKELKVILECIILLHFFDFIDDAFDCLSYELIFWLEIYKYN